MPNIASLLKQEIVRLARKELRAETQRLKQTVQQQRGEVVALKKRIAELERQVARQGKARRVMDAAKDEGERSSLRFSAKGFARQRERLGVSAADFARLLGVSAQTVYHWEAGKSRPRRSQLAAIAAVRGLGKRAVAAKLAAAD
jgi:DNA-binding transcriptional regulator YiaG